MLSKDKALAKATAQMFRTDFQNFNTLKHFKKPAWVAALRDDSPFNTVPVRQHIGCLMDASYDVDNAVYTSWLKKNRTRPLLSQAVEDGFCRGVKDIDKGMHQDRCRDRAYATLVDKKILGEVHDHTEVDYSWVRDVRNPHVPAEVYHQSASAFDAEGDFKKIKGAKRDPEWPHFSATTENRPVVEMGLLEHARELGTTVNNIKTTIYCTLAKAGHVVVKKIGQPQWYLSMGDLYGICALGVPVTSLKLPSTGRGVFKL
eukprot:8409526-Pyramimonas_sp.AAC.1